MPYDKYVQINETWHQVGDDEHTTSGVVIPPLTEWVKELPEGAKLAFVHLDGAWSSDAEPKPKAKAKK